MGRLFVGLPLCFRGELHPSGAETCSVVVTPMPAFEGGRRCARIRVNRGVEKMVKILGITIGEKDKKEKSDQPKTCKHSIMRRGMRLNPEKQQMETFCRDCGQVIEE